MFKLIILAVLASLTFSLYADTKVIYGDDDRVDVYSSTNSMYVELAESTAAQIPESSVVFQMSDGSYSIEGDTLESRGICAVERFSQQMTAARCSGFLVGEDLLVTAGHCMKSARDCSDNKWVFDYKQSGYSKGITVPGTSVYSCAEIISQELNSFTKNDYALVRLDRKVFDREPLTFRTRGKIRSRTRLVVIGHPTGLPTKIADGANVRSNSNKYYFSANLDTYGGNSGSAVFSSANGTVEGILVRGETDYVYDSNLGCRVSNRCANSECRGEDVTRITAVKDLINNYLYGERL